MLYISATFPDIIINLWGNELSNEFKVENWAKQGAILSPTLFSIYIDGIFDTLKTSRLGCTIKNNYHGAIAYTDDIVLLSPYRDGLQKCLIFLRNILKNLI